MWKKVAFFEVMLYDGLHKENIMKTTTTKLMIRQIIGGVFTMKKWTGWRSCLAVCLAVGNAVDTVFADRGICSRNCECAGNGCIGNDSRAFNVIHEGWQDGD